MKIYGIPKGGVEEPRGPGSPERKRKDLPAAGSASRQDRVSLSSDARQLLEAEKALQAPSEDRVRRLEQLRKQLQEGTYRPDSAAVAARMLESMLGDLGGE